MSIFAWTLIVACVVLLAFSLFRYAGFLASNVRAGLLGEIRDHRGGLVRPVLAGMATSFVAGVAALMAYPLAWLPRREAEAGNLPVVLVHGLYHNRSAWPLFARHLARAGFTDLHTYEYNSFTGRFDEAVDGLCRTLDRLLGPRRGARAILVGHSLGGLVCRAAAVDPRCRGRVAALVALGSPHAGSELARMGLGAMARGLIPGRGAAQGGIPAMVGALPEPDCPRLALTSPVDDFVFPRSCLRPGRPGWIEHTVRPMGHVYMLYSPEVADATAEFLREATSAGAVRATFAEPI
ncbi:alpha/beta fold hydrolase [Pseudodesulfovibrio sp. F-1]|uniref:Alpha/beta fold hydrolase n=1 Tax=Pseudodesulfovibrio alkaliphilus TaxID=2661613 RepID=A0A7K1KNQ0_9BACT|nr:alpha/beta fold hydrolase [Pseudodesulfovibrio alkaliphilus]MUM77677.1 alpha/beta fold hydrolase [Pseudodesulfovibrio alkaliphilus]